MRKYASYHRKQKETSKQLLKFSVAMVIVITIVTVIAVFVFGDLTPLEFLIGGVFGLASSSFCFYYYKAKCENIIKLGGSISDITNIDNNDIV